MRYISPHSGLRLFDGPHGTVRFENGGYNPISDEEDAWLQQHPDFGIRFFLEGDRATKPKTAEEALREELEAVKRERDSLNQQISQIWKQFKAVKEELERMKSEGRNVSTGHSANHSAHSANHSTSSALEKATGDKQVSEKPVAKPSIAEKLIIRP